MLRPDDLGVLVVGDASGAWSAAGVRVRSSLARASEELSPAIGALVVGPRLRDDPELAHLLAWRDREPAWSEVPIVVVGAEDPGLEDLVGRVLFTGPGDLGTTVDRARRIRVRQLVRRDRDHQDALSILIHELRNPLAAITNAVYLLRHGGSSPRVLDLLDRQVKQLVTTLDDVRDRSEQG
jgi:signal transduction histidine kinase